MCIAMGRRTSASIYVNLQSIGINWSMKLDTGGTNPSRAILYSLALGPPPVRKKRFVPTDEGRRLLWKDRYEAEKGGWGKKLIISAFINGVFIESLRSVGVKCDIESFTVWIFYCLNLSDFFMLWFCENAVISWCFRYINL